MNQLPSPKGEVMPRTRRGNPYGPETRSYDVALSEEQESGSLLAYFRLLARHKLALILITLAGVLSGILIALPQSPVYRARTAFEIQDLNDRFLNIQQSNPISDGAGYTAMADLQTQIKLLQSDSLIKQTLAKLTDQTPEKSKAQSPLPWWRRLFHIPERKVSEDLDPDQAAQSLRVVAARQTRIIEAFYDSTDPRFAAAFLNMLAQQFIDTNIEARWKMTEYASDWLSRQLEDMRVKLEQSEDTLLAYAHKSGLMITSEKTNLSEEKLRQVQAELSRAEADRATAEARWDISQQSPPDTLYEVLGDTSLRALQDKITELRRQRAELITIYTDNHSKVKRVEAQIAPLQVAFEQARSSIINRLGSDYQAALKRERLLKAEYADQSRLVNAEGEKSIEYNIIQREVDSNRLLYEAMLQRVKEAKIASALRASNVRIIDPAEPPKHPYKPNYMENGGLGLLGGLLVGIAFVVMRERSDRTLQSPGEVRYWLNVPELQVIPNLNNKPDGKLAPRTKSAPVRLSPLTITTPLLLSADNAEADVAGLSSPELVACNGNHSTVSESFLSLLTSILLSGEDGDRPKVLLLTSAHPGEGKTMVASNLGITLAQIKRRVVILDADLRKPRIHELFEIPNEKGLRNLLETGIHPLEAGANFVKPMKIPGLFVLPSGPPTHNAANLLYSENVPILLARLKQAFDMVIIDSPPMLDVPDARILGRMADAVILVTRVGRTTRDAAMAAKQRLADDNIRVFGTILNDWDPKNSAQEYYYGYARQYHD